MRMMVADLINGTTVSGTSDLIGSLYSGTGTYMYVAVEPLWGSITNENITYRINSFKTVNIKCSIPVFKYPENIKQVDVVNVRSAGGTFLYGCNYVAGTLKASTFNYQFLNSVGLVAYAGTSPETMKLSSFYLLGTAGTVAYTFYFYQEETYNNDFVFVNELRNNTYLLPEQAGYSPYFTEDKIKHKLDNGKTLTYFKGFNFNADINFEQLSGTELDNLKTIKNLKTNLRFFPNIAEKPDLSYDVIWDSDFNYPFTTPTWTQGGYNGNIHFEGISRLGSIGDTI